MRVNEGKVNDQFQTDCLSYTFYCGILTKENTKNVRACKANKEPAVVPPLHLIEHFLKSSLNWRANVLVAVLPVTVALDAGLASCLLHSYGSFQGIFTRTQVNHTRPCPAMGFAMGVYDLSARC